MTQLSSAGSPGFSAGVTADLSEGQIINGKIAVWMNGSLRPVERWEAVHELSWLSGSPIPETQARARRIRAALEQAGAVQ
ncbi:MAG: hypothetical protein EON87_13665 [Brevundimonas sp.]|nr:MAG: hypothetical protein EON87_13665 [Brevundimonas sp.]